MPTETTPSTTVQTVGVAPLKWGTHNETFGYAENISFTPEADIEELKQGDGTTVGLIISNPRLKFSGEWTPISGATLPVSSLIAWVGSILSVTDPLGTTYQIVVSGGSEKYAKAKSMTYGIEGTHWPSVAVATVATA